MEMQAKPPMSPYWIPETPLILASKSSARREMLVAAGLAVEVIAANIDERSIPVDDLDNTGKGDEIALRLARAKADHIAGLYPDRYILAADQTLTLDNSVLHKAASLSDAREQLRRMSGRHHRLSSAAVLKRNNETILAVCETAILQVRVLSESFLDRYLQQGTSALLSSVGCYQIENTGIHLFKKIEGNHFTIMGLPLLSLLKSMREAKLVLE